MRIFAALTLCAAVGCGNQQLTPISPELREAVKTELIQIDARVTSSSERAIYLSLRNTHVHLSEQSLNINGDRSTRRNVKDFVVVGEATARRVLGENEYEQFRKWLQSALGQRGTATQQTEFEKFKVTLSRQHLLLLFTQKHGR